MKLLLFDAFDIIVLAEQIDGQLIGNALGRREIRIDQSIGRIVNDEITGIATLDSVDEVRRNRYIK